MGLNTQLRIYICVIMDETHGLYALCFNTLTNRLFTSYICVS